MEPDTHPDAAYLLFNTRHASPISVFLHYITPELLQNVWNDKNNGEFCYHGQKMIHINHGQFSLGLIYKFLAIKLRIQGIHNKPQENTTNYRPQRQNIAEAIEYFREKQTSPSPPGIEIMECLLTHFLFSYQYFYYISERFQSFVKEIGEFVAGDEKLFHFTGKSGDLRKVPSKPQKVGLWFYELVAKINESTPYLLDIKLWSVHKEWGESEVLAKVVQRWTKIIRYPSTNQQYCVSIHITWIVWLAHSYYVKSFAILPRRWRAIDSLNCEKSHRCMSNILGLYNDQTNEIYVHYYDEDPNIGEKTVIGNALRHVQGRKQPVEIIPENVEWL